jgi:hypothetical protein
MSNLAGKAYALTVISPQRSTWVNRLIYAVFRLLPDRMQVLHNLKIIHFARWVLLPADRWPGAPAGWRSRHGYILFASNFNNTWDTYLDEFSDILSLGLDGLWYRGVGFPKSLPSSPFKTYIDRNSHDAGLFYNATPGHGVRDVCNAFFVREAITQLEGSLQALDGDASLSEAERERRFQQAFHRVFRGVQNRLPTPGEAPLAAQEMEDLKTRRGERITSLEQLKAPYGFQPPLEAGTVAMRRDTGKEPCGMNGDRKDHAQL